MFHKKQIFIELKTSRLTIAIAEKKIFRNIRAYDVLNISLEQSIFNNGVIHNPSTVCTYIQAFLKKQNINNARAIISIPELRQTQGLITTLTVFQTALCLSKTKLIITKIINTPIFDFESNLRPKVIDNATNLLELLGSKKIKSPIFWVTSIFVCLVMSLFAMKQIRCKMLTQLLTLRSKISKLKSQTEKLNAHLRDFSQIKNQNNKITNSIKTLEKAKNTQTNPVMHLLFISSNIPENLYLTNININRKTVATNLVPTNNTQVAKNSISAQKNNFIELSGLAENIQSVNNFIQALTKNNKLFNKIEISFIKKIQHSKETPPSKNDSTFNLKYQFQASGQLIYVAR